MEFFPALWQTAIYLLRRLSVRRLKPVTSSDRSELERLIRSPMMIPVDRFLSLSVSNPLLLSATHAFLLIWGGPASLAKDFVHVS